MAGKIKNNKHLINAPAGSGKTTYIRNELKSICLNNPESRILCITYTNRAADELKKNLEGANITVSTIHSYINDLISPFYSHKEVLDLYWEIYAEKIKNRIKNVTNDENIKKSNQYYIEKYGELTEKAVQENISELSYGETPFTSLYTGKLSHDDLLMFANKLIKRYPILLRKIGDKYNYIFIDEYQDTSAYVLDIFYDAVENRENIQIYLFGDRMQQIYKNYDGSFEERLKKFDTSDQLGTNFRSIGKIVSILNNIYNDASFKQYSTEKSKFDKIQAEYEKEGCLIRDIVECLFANGFIPEAVKNDFEESTEYQSVLDIKIIEVKNLARYLNMPHISTQHGVKGESHSSVIFMASDNNSTPNVRMYPFFELWSNLEFSLPQFETLFYSYNRMIEKVEAELGMKISELTAETHNKSEKNKAILVRYSNEVLEKYQGNILFDALCKDDFISYLAKQNVGNAKKIFKITKMEGILTAYKLFYVGCSRARKNLIVVVDAYKVNGFKEAFMNKMKEIGFSVFCK